MVRIQTPWKVRIRREFRHWQLLLLLLPALAYILVFNYWPMYGLQIAFRDYSARKGFWNSPFVGWKHFERFLSYPLFWQIVRNTLTLSVYSLVVGFPFPIITALLLNEVRSNLYKKTVQMVVFLPHFISMVALCGMIALFTDRSAGLFNNLRTLAGMERVAFLQVGRYFKHIYVWSAIWQNTGFASVIYIAQLSSVDANLIEAATIDGANRLQIMYHINFQCLKPVAITQLILRAGQLLTLRLDRFHSQDCTVI